MNASQCDDVCQKLTDLNGALIKSIINSLTDLLKDINTSIELSGRVDEEILSRLAKMEQQISSVVALAGGLPEKSEAMHKVMLELSGNCGYVNPTDRVRLQALLRRVADAAVNWTDEEKNTLVDVIEGLGGTAISARRKIKRLYWLLASAGVVTVLAQVGAPSWIQKLLALIMGQ